MIGIIACNGSSKPTAQTPQTIPLLPPSTAVIATTSELLPADAGRLPAGSPAIDVPAFESAWVEAMGEDKALLTLVSWKEGRRWSAVVDLDTACLTAIGESVDPGDVVLIVPKPENPAPRPRSHGFDPAEGRDVVVRDRKSFARVGRTPPLQRGDLAIVEGHDENGSDVLYVTHDAGRTFSLLDPGHSYSPALNDDGHWIAWQNSPGGPYHVRIQTLDGPKVRKDIRMPGWDYSDVFWRGTNVYALRVPSEYGPKKGARIQCLDEIAMPSARRREAYCFKSKKFGTESLRHSPGGRWIAVKGYGPPGQRGDALQSFDLETRTPGAVHYGFGVSNPVRDDGAIAWEVPASPSSTMFRVGWPDGRMSEPEPGEPLAWTRQGALLVRAMTPWKRDTCGNFAVKHIP